MAKPFYGRVVQTDGTLFVDEIVLAKEKQGTLWVCERLDGSQHLVNETNLATIVIPRHFAEVRVAFAAFDCPESKGDLQFPAFALIGVVERLDDNWAKGQIFLDNGKSIGMEGMFPLNYTHVLKGLEQTEVEAQFQVVSDVMDDGFQLRKGETVKVVGSSQEDWVEVKTSDQRQGKCPRQFLQQKADVAKAERQDFNGEPHCRALFDFDADYEGELSLKEGIMVKLIKKWNADWFEGEYEENDITKRGVFPSNHVEIMVDGDSSSPVNASEAEIESKRFGAFDYSEPDTIGFATVLYDFQARFQDELNVNSGFSVRIIELPDSEWAKCFNPMTFETGLIPQTFLQIFLDDETELNNAALNPVPSYSSDLNTIPLYSYDENRFSTSYDQNRTSTTSFEFNRETADSWETPFSNSINYDRSGDDPKKDSGNVSLNSEQETMKENNLHKASVDSDFNQLFGLKSSKQLPPQRPPPPQVSLRAAVRMAPPPPSTPSSEQVFGQFSKPSTPADWQAQFQKIVEELLASETNYNLELHAWEECIKSSSRLSEQKKCVLVNGFPMLKDLSQRLIRLISNEMDKPLELQSYGLLFMDLREKISKTYAYHFRCVEEMAQIVENKNDVELQRALKECLEEMNKMGVFVFDVPTAVARPIQRVLKYPLFINELIKILPLTHSDHPKLLEANKQMAQLVSKMNESKRKKELMNKYTDSKKDSITDKLSKINLHTVVKKSNRLKYRIASTMGLTNKPDPEFSVMVSELDSAERRLCKFLYHVQVYRARLTFMVKKYIGRNTVEKNKTFSYMEENLRKEFNQFLRRIGILLKEHMRAIQNAIVTPSQQLQKCEYAKLIEKRCDKLADYELAKAAARPFDEIEKKRCEFEALNNHTKNNLPKIWMSINEKVRKMTEILVDLDSAYFVRVEEVVKSIPQKLAMFNLITFTNFVDPGGQRLMNLQKFLLLPSEKVNKKNRKSFREVFAENKRSIDREYSLRPQNDRERDALIKILKAQNRLPDLRKVICDYSSPRMLLKKGDIVVIIRFENGFCHCDNSVNTDKVPLNILVPFDDFGAYDTVPGNSISDYKPTTYKSAPVAQKPQTIKSNGHAKPVRQKSQNLIDLDATTPPAKPKPTIDQILDLDFSTPLKPENYESLTLNSATKNNVNVPSQNGRASAVSLPPPLPARTSTTSPLELIMYDKEPTRSASFNQKSEPSFAELAAKSRPFQNQDSQSKNDVFGTTSTDLNSFGTNNSDPFGTISTNLNINTNQNSNSFGSTGTSLDSFGTLNREIDPFASFSPTPNSSLSPKYQIPQRSTHNRTPLPNPVPLISPRKDNNTGNPLYDVVPNLPPAPHRIAPAPPAKKRPTDLGLDNKKVFVCEFDFSPVSDDSNQLKIRENDKVVLLRDSDEVGNNEWYLVQKPNGPKGYVPGVYLREATQDELKG
ncbi:unnamed protein product [Bursaphelenchus okinawaensis]|uniref:SH3 domain-containing GRB2-like protein n=1 Tax=Bursaphelenchus okinawaensis TaxID=465554 RepID=A0A811KSP0_9BILA|nr:unnamed protein product [Bursaphelenchus okinawaensis]CAG9111549.1 unnamed protein product [Bursaphelenchus okinawaensis]